MLASRVLPWHKTANDIVRDNFGANHAQIFLFNLRQKHWVAGYFSLKKDDIAQTLSLSN